MKWIRAKVGGAGGLLLATAALHATGYRSVMSHVEGGSLPPELVAVVGGLWMFFSWHLFAVGVAAVLAAIVGSTWLRPAILFCAVVTLIDFWLLFRVTGWFPGTILILLAGLGLLVGGWYWKTPENDSAVRQDAG